MTFEQVGAQKGNLSSRKDMKSVLWKTTARQKASRWLSQVKTKVSAAAVSHPFAEDAKGWGNEIKYRN
jgi:hypothetical protein